jgi:hypothetical protein
MGLPPFLRLSLILSAGLEGPQSKRSEIVNFQALIVVKLDILVKACVAKELDLNPRRSCDGEAGGETNPLYVSTIHCKTAETKKAPDADMEDKHDPKIIHRSIESWPCAFLHAALRDGGGPHRGGRRAYEGSDCRGQSG